MRSMWRSWKVFYLSHTLSQSALVESLTAEVTDWFVLSPTCVSHDYATGFWVHSCATHSGLICVAKSVSSVA
ncbi:hypothetical protein PR001_g27799 [Phytophthora rubi]|uniref:Secreted protein n=1 Tax=Phytophthora rubi TaxID=129364 RepID=A0A6A3HI55_9STRA|nr:hypothetical protein PR002_g27856 [Phytophthora rubi]KAE8968414.1 hypothetical protein PR001_g27799 [Phytophthora rubi]